MPRYAAIDIGSNSVRLLASEVVPGSPPRALAADRQVTRLGESVFRNGYLSEDAIANVCKVLETMAAQYRRFDVAGVRAVATAAVRDASNQREFLKRASAAAGAPVEIISGQEEARLIHLGVQSVWPHREGDLLIVDIGGGSAEMILSQHGRQRVAFSKPLGAVRLTELFLKNDPPTARELLRLEEYIGERIANAVERIGRRKFTRVIGTSATASALVCAVARVPRSRREEADRVRASAAQLRKLFRQLAASDLARRRKVTGIGPRRAEIIVAGAATLTGILNAFGAPSLYYSRAGVRDGVIADLAARNVGKELSQLSPEQRSVVEEMAQRYGVSLKHARKVAGFTHTLFTSLQTLHRLPHGHGKLLEAAAYLHDTGHYVSDTRHHKHSWYLVANSDMPGFDEREREIVATLCRYHRKAMPSPAHPQFVALPAEERRAVLLLTPLLRIADGLDRSHDQRLRKLECHPRESDVLLRIGSDADTNLEQWAAERAGEIFRQVYNVPVTLERVR